MIIDAGDSTGRQAESGPTSHGGRPFRVLYHEYHQKVDTGGPRVLMSIIRGLDRSIFQPFYVTDSDGPLVDALRTMGVTILRSPVQSITYRRPLAAFARLLSIRKLLKDQKIDLVHDFQFGWNVDLVLGSRLAGVPVILHEHAGGEEIPVQNLSRLAASRVVFCSAAQRDSFYPLRRIRCPIEVICNAVDTERFSPGSGHAAREALGYCPGDLVLGTVGVVSYGKGIDIFLDTLCLLLPRWKNLKAVVVGHLSDAEPEFVRDQVKRAASPPLQGVVKFLGSRTDIPELLRGLDIFVFPTRAEAFGLAPLEALACGIPCVASDVGGVSEIVQTPHGGRLVSDLSPNAFAAALEPLLESASLRAQLGVEARRSVERFSPSEIDRRWQQVYLETVRRG